MQDHVYQTSALHGLPLYSSAFAGTRAYSRRGGQAGLTWVDVLYAKIAYTPADCSHPSQM